MKKICHQFPNKTLIKKHFLEQVTKMCNINQNCQLNVHETFSCPSPTYLSQLTLTSTYLLTPEQIEHERIWHIAAVKACISMNFMDLATLTDVCKICIYSSCMIRICQCDIGQVTLDQEFDLMMVANYLTNSNHIHTCTFRCYCSHCCLYTHSGHQLSQTSSREQKKG